MFERYMLIGLVVSFIIVVLDFYLLKERKIKGKAFFFWLIVGSLLGLFSVFPTLILVFDLIFGTQFTVSAILLTVFLFFLLTTFYFHYRISELQSMLAKLAMEISVKKYTENNNPHDLSKKPWKNSSHENK